MAAKLKPEVLEPELEITEQDTKLVPVKPAIELRRQPAEWESKVELIKRTIAKGCTNDELDLFLYQARRTGLDPLAKQIHAIKRWNNKENREVMSIQTGIDGFRLIADRTGKYAGSDDPVVDQEPQPNKATVTVYKMVEGQRCAFTATARWDEYFPGEKQGFMWKKMPCVMLGKCAEALALRKAFPAELSGLYTFDEMAQAGASAPHEPEAEEVANDTIEGFVTAVEESKGVTWISVIDEKEETWACVARRESVLELLRNVAKGDRVELLVNICAKPGKKTFCDIMGVMALDKEEDTVAQ